jgi:site-specific DNA-methyltransferase (adenine-specific)
VPVLCDRQSFTVPSAAPSDSHRQRRRWWLRDNTECPNEPPMEHRRPRPKSATTGLQNNWYYVVQNWSLRSAKALIIRELAAAEQSEFEALMHLRNVGEEWLAIKSELGERGLNIAAWCAENMPVSRQWLDRHAELFKHWKKFLVARKWSTEVGYVSRRQSGLEFALELMAARDRSELLSKESKLAFGRFPERPGAAGGVGQSCRSGTATRTMLNKATTLYHGDCSEIMTAIPDGTIDVMIVDPPFFLNVPTGPTVIDYYIAKNGMKPRFREAWDQFDDEAEYLRFSNDLFEQTHRIIAATGSVFVFTVHNNLAMIDLAIRRAGLTVLHHILWVKRNPTPMLSTRRLQFSHEAVVWCVKSKSYHFNYDSLRAAAFTGDRFKIAGRQHRDIIETNTSSGESVGHPAQKPVAVYRRLLEIAGRQGGMLLDPCAGSGTAAVAAQEFGMRSILIERDDRYAEMIRRRFRAG